MSVTDNYRRIRAEIDAAARRVGREPESVTLVGASKRQEIGRLQEAFEAGLRVFGENRVQEGEEKRPQLPAEAEWHLIGPLQSNKAKRAVQTFGTVESIDRPKIARALDRHAGEAGKRITGLLEINLGDEPSKHGFSTANLVEQLAPLRDLANIEIVGLMAIPPFEPDPEASRTWFRRLRQLRDEVAGHPEWSDFPGWLSMGMSHDFAVAVEEGATHVRVGTALFGARP